MSRKKAGTVRIIGGRWRGRRLPVADLPGLRPSGDRARETLFNWLQMDLRGARCADLFAGTGVLGLEAASRGAAHTVLVENAPRAVQALRSSVQLLAPDGGRDVSVVETDALAWLEACPAGSLDIVFIDPPFGCGLEGRVLEILDRRECLAPGGLVYVETARQEPAVLPPPGWESVRDKCLGEVRMQLLKKI